MAHAMTSRSTEPNNFAFLSDDIVYDILEFAHFERLRRRRCNYQTMRFQGGRWGEIAGKFEMFSLNGSWVERCYYDKTKKGLVYDYVLMNADDFYPLSGLYVNKETDFGQLQHLASNLYERIDFGQNATLCPLFLAALGTRFTSIKWWKNNGTVSFNGDPMTDEEVDFLARQLQSPLLRSLECDAPDLASAYFSELLVAFVRRKNFEKLDASSPVCLSAKVFEAAYEAWIQRKDNEHLESLIVAKPSPYGLHDFTAKISDFQWTEHKWDRYSEFRFSEAHPNWAAYKYKMSMKFMSNVLTMKFHYGGEIE